MAWRKNILHVASAYLKRPENNQPVYSTLFSTKHYHENIHHFCVLIFDYNKNTLLHACRFVIGRLIALPIKANRFVGCSYGILTKTQPESKHSTYPKCPGKRLPPGIPQNNQLCTHSNSPYLTQHTLMLSSPRSCSRQI